MKKTALLLILLALKFAPAKAQWVTIPDANFVTWLTLQYPSCMSGNQMDTTCSEIVNETFVGIYYLDTISNLTGIQYFDNLRRLSCNSQPLTTLPPLPKNLDTLMCGGNQLISLPPLPDSLKLLNCVNNQLTILPILPTTLKVLWSINNQLTSLPPLPNSLYELSTYNNLLTNLPALPNSLNSLSCNNNLLTSLPSLPNSLTGLSCHSNQLSNLPPLPNSLISLIASYNQLTSLPPLPNTLHTLACGNNQLTAIASLPNSMVELYCNNNQLINLPNLPNTLQRLNCSFNQLVNAPIPPSNWMINYYINNNNISCIPILPNVYYTPPYTLLGDISNNPLTCLPNQSNLNYNVTLPLCINNDSINNPNNCSGVNILGNVYKDLNGNCSKDISDLSFQNIPVKLYDSQNNLLQLSYAVNGIYGFAVLQPDTFHVKINDNILPLSMSCGQSNNQIVTIDSVNQIVPNIDFPMECDSLSDLKVQSVSRHGWVHPGEMHILKTNIINSHYWYNLNCSSSTFAGTVTIVITGPVTYVSPYFGALTPQVIGNTFTYNINNFDSIAPSSFWLRFMTDTTAQVGNQICVHVEISPLPMDGDTTNNEYDFCYHVVNSYDPNMKEVYPVNVLPGYDDWFTYTIHFQNTGNAPAFNIRLRDTLDTQLDINTFEVLGYSHTANTTLSGNILTVRFNNIMLPDSTTDYEGSMGYFQYRIKPISNLPNGSQISNTAYIYFDYNAPIVTNTTQNNFDMTVNTKDKKLSTETFQIYPNPSTGIFTFKDSKNIKTIEVYNLMGELILSQGNAKQINLSEFPKGIYVARINGQFVNKLVKE